MGFYSAIQPLEMSVISLKDSIFKPSADTLASRMNKAVKRKQTAIAVATLKKGVLGADDVERYLLTASDRGDVPLLAALVETGVDINVQYTVGKISNPFGSHETITNALIRALQHKQEQAADFLLDKGAYADSETFAVYSGALTLMKEERNPGKSAFAIAQKAGFNTIASRIKTALEADTVAAPQPKAAANTLTMS